MSQPETNAHSIMNQIIDNMTRMDGKYLNSWTDKYLYQHARNRIFVVEVNEAAVMEEQDMFAPPQLSGDYVNAYLTGIGDRDEKVMLFVDVTKMLAEDIVKNLINAGGTNNV